jgi:Mg-chelatase subunit ChlD
MDFGQRKRITGAARGQSCAVVALAAAAISLNMLELGASAQQDHSKQSGDQATAGVHLKAGVSKTDLGVDLEGRFGVRVRKSDSPAFKAVVDNIRPGSMAFYSGLSAGDRIIAAKGDNDRVSVTFDRGGKVYSVSLAALQPQVLPSTQKVRKPDISALVPEQKRKILADHDIVLIIDRTGSMQTPDCPDGKSRWNWCRDQALSFMQDMDGYLKDVDVITFNDSYVSRPHSSARDIADIFRTVKPDGNTDTAAPLHAVLSDYFKRRANGNARPLLIAVLTDGLPNLPSNPTIAKLEVQKEVVQAVSQMNNAGEIGMTFLQVGQDFQGGQFLTDLSEHLGVPYDIVETKTFSELQRVGLRDALVEAVCAQKTYSVEAKIAVPVGKK